MIIYDAKWQQTIRDGVSATLTNTNPWDDDGMAEVAMTWAMRDPDDRDLVALRQLLTKIAWEAAIAAKELAI